MTITLNGTTGITSTGITETSDGNVGLGTDAPSSLLHLIKNDVTAYSATATDGQVGVGPTIYLENPANANNTVGGQIVFGMRSTEEQARIGATGGTAPALTFGTADAERLRIDSSGNLLVGTTTAFGKTNFIGSGTNSSAPVVYANNNSGSAAAWNFYSRLESGSNSGSAVHFGGLTAGVGSWYLLGNGTSSWSSDARLKKNIETTRDGYLEDLCQLRVVKYNWHNHDDTAPKELGLIAQEVEQVFPGLVMESLNPDEDGNTHKMVKGSVIPYMLLKAIQEQQAIIEEQKTALEALTARVSALEATNV